MQDDWPVPNAALLQEAARTWDLLRRSPVDTERMLYVAGWAPNTVSAIQDQSSRGLFEGKRPPVKFLATKQGDGTVTWESGRLPGVKTWYLAAAAHDQLPAHRAAFPAFLDLLQEGNTARLPQSPPAASRAAAGIERTPMPPDMPDRMPSERDIASLTFGGGSAEPPTDGVPAGVRPRLVLCHGHLGYARFPVCVGHYQGDTLVSAEADLDRRLGGVLSQRMKLRLYPGLLGTREVFIRRDRHAKPNGAIVVGLGQVGELRPGHLESGMLRALLDYAVAVADREEGATEPGRPRSAGISALLIGTSAGGIPIRDSIDAILRAVKAANQRLSEAGLAEKVQIDAVEFFELYRDRAIQAARALHAVLRDGDLADGFQWEPQQIEPRPGGMSRVSFDEPQSWWHRTEISYDPKRGELRFVALTDKARAEESLVAGQMQLAERFIEEAIGSTDSAIGVARTLFEILLPNGYKELAPNQNDVVLVLDETSARYPWELVQDRWSPSGRPPAVEAGLLRQLKTREFRVRPAHAYEKTAYVVGNPLLPDGGIVGDYQFVDLPGAEKEAEAVAGVLFDLGYAVTRAIRAEAGEILMNLHAERYRILHLSGHGVHDFPLAVAERPGARCGACEQALPAAEKLVSGMVIGNGIILTPGDVEQMRWVPELVFINCCHLGRTDATSQNPHWRPSRLAANLGAQFIRMGVRAVVAAGWAVDDAAAEHFARVFYDHLIHLGETLGAAVRAAREEVYLRFPGVNTWGAYQVYGDPAFRLVLDGGDFVAAGGKPPPPFVDPEELQAELENLANRLHVSSGGQEPDGEAEAWLTSVLDRIPPALRGDWLKRSDIAGALGTVHGELENYDDALDSLNQAVKENRAAVSVRHLEQRANFKVKAALQDWLRAPAGSDAKAPAKAIEDEAIPELEWLRDQLGPTEERLCLLGSAYKRLAWIQSAAKKKDLTAILKSMADNYQRAFELHYERKKETGDVKPYPFTNWMTAEILCAWFNEGTIPHLKRLEAEFRRLCTIAQAAATRRDDREPDFWNSLVEADCRLALNLLEFTVADKRDREAPALADAGRIAEAYRRALARGASAKERASVVEHLDFLAALAARQKDYAVLARELRELPGRFEAP
jgi:hypothetical protein